MAGLWGELPDYLYRALANAETGGEGKKFIRTKDSKDGGSSAYGPVQITKNLVSLEKNAGLFKGTDVENYVNRYLEQARKFLKYGKEPNLKGYDPRYDYGGEGDLTSDKDKEDYRKMADILIDKHWEQAVEQSKKPNGIDAVDYFVREWKYGMPKMGNYSLSDKRTKSYFDRFKKGMMLPYNDMENVYP